jgi:hypothetical protein
VLRYPALQKIEGKEASMTSLLRHACLASVFVATAVPASAQTWVYEPDNGSRYYNSNPAPYYEPRYEPRYNQPPPAAYYEPRYNGWDARARVYEPDARAVVATQPLALTPTQRTTIYRTIIPQGRGRGPIVRERIVTETMAPAPVVEERVVRGAVAADYVVGSRVSDAYALAPLPRAVVNTVPAVRSYRYMVVNNRLLLVDPATGFVVADVSN